MVSNKVNSCQFLVHTCIFIVFFVVVCANYHFYFTNEFTPGGDGVRIYPYLKYMEKVPETIPFWHAHKHHGYPLISDPENYMPLGLVLNTESANFNFHLNLVFLLLTSIFAFTCRAIARILGMSQIASIVVGLITVVTVPMSRLFTHGSLNALIYYVLTYLSLAILLGAMTLRPGWRFMMFLAAPLFLAWTVQVGYYLPLLFHLPALFFLACFYFKQKETIASTVKKSILLLSILTFLMVLYSMPFLLSLVDGILVAKTFTAETPTIKISDVDVYNYKMALWPFILLAVFFTRGLYRRFAILFLSMASIDFILIFFKSIHFDSFFQLWANTPILKNIRWQHVFREQASISSAFCAGLFWDSCWGRFKSGQQVHRFLVMLFVLLLAIIILVQYEKNVPLYMIVVSTMFIVLGINGTRRYTALVLMGAIYIIMAVNCNVSPISNQFYKAENRQSFKHYKKDYAWWNNYGYDKFTPTFKYHKFSMVFMDDYRTLLSLLYKQTIYAQRPHWVRRLYASRQKDINQKIARLMGIRKPGSDDEDSPFRLYDKWLVVDHAHTVKMMQQEDFTPDAIALLAEAPESKAGPDKKAMQGSVELTSKTSDTLQLHVVTNKTSIVLIPEIYHRNWTARINGRQTKVIKAFASLRAVQVPPGRHTITMSFVYMPFWYGFGISIASLLAVSAILIYKQKKTHLFQGL
jgi:hypothetical protein